MGLDLLIFSGALYNERACRLRQAAVLVNHLFFFFCFYFALEGRRVIKVSCIPSTNRKNHSRNKGDACLFNHCPSTPLYPSTASLIVPRYHSDPRLECTNNSRHLTPILNLGRTDLPSELETLMCPFGRWLSGRGYEIVCFLYWTRFHTGPHQRGHECVA